MKSTVKIDYQIYGNGGLSVIKIVQPLEVLKPEPQDDVDPRDTMVAQFVHNPISQNPSDLFVRDTYYPHPFDNPTHYVTKIKAVSNEERIYTLENILINTIVEWNIPFEVKEIEKFFERINAAIGEPNRKRQRDLTVGS